MNEKQHCGFHAPIVLACVLLTSGLIHLILLWATGANWEGPLSLRKPGLFGVSAGMTLWSMIWVLRQLKSCPFDRHFANLIAGSLFAEVALITIQNWRGVPSHFNRATRLDATCEAIMFGLIVFVTLGIAWMCWRSLWLPPMNRSLATAIRAGLWLLLTSCLLGIVSAIAGEFNIALGRSPEYWGRSGVLKYPHGAALHAIQILPLLSILALRFGLPHANQFLCSAVGSHVVFIVHALWQTFNGRSRLDLDFIGGFSLSAALALIVVPIIAIVWRAMSQFEKIKFKWSHGCRN